MAHREPAIFHPEANYNREAFPPLQLHIRQGRATHMNAVPEQMPPAWQSQTHADLPVYLDRLQGVARTSRDVSDSGLLQSYARLRRDLLVTVGRMDDDVIRLRRHEALLDESQAGPLLATIHQLRDDKDNLLQRNQILQMAAAAQSPDELAKA